MNSSHPLAGHGQRIEQVFRFPFEQQQLDLSLGGFSDTEELSGAAMSALLLAIGLMTGERNSTFVVRRVRNGRGAQALADILTLFSMPIRFPSQSRLQCLEPWSLKSLWRDML